MRRKPSLWRGWAGAGAASVLCGAALLAASARSEAGQSPFAYISLGNSLSQFGLNGPGGAADLLVSRQKPWLLSSASQFRPGPPPADRSPQTLSELSELRSFEAQRNDITDAEVRYWNSGPATQRWTETALSFIQRDKINPVRAARILGCLHTAMADAVIATWDAKYTYWRRSPAVLARGLHPSIPVSSSPTYPSEHAAVSETAAAVLGHLFPNDAPTLAAMAEEACQTRLLACANYPSDVDAGITIGQKVGQLAIARADTDGSSASWTGTVPTGPGLWTGTHPLEPLAGTWKTWILASGRQLRPGPPPPFGSAQFLTELAEVKQVCNNATPSQRAIALFWADDPGTVTPPGHWFVIANQLIARDNLSTPAAARMLALLGAAVNDAAVSCWDTKYAYWAIRPVQADPSIHTIIATPNFPTYTSGHSTFSSAASEVLAYFFPNDAVALRAMAQEAGLSRLFAGIHYRSDIEVGAQVGRELAALAVARDRQNP